MDSHNDDNVTGRVRQPSESDEKSGKRQKTLSTSSNEESYNAQIGSTAASPPHFVLLEEVMNTAKELTNMSLANEIALNSDFKLKPKELPEDSLEKRIDVIMRKAFWDILSQDLQKDPPDYTRALSLLSEIKEILLSLLLPRHHKFREQVNEILDLELIEQQAKVGSLDFMKYAKYILSLMSKICAPVRDSRIKEVEELADPVEIYKGIMETLQEMRLDMINFTIQVIRPGIVDYEKNEFRKLLDKCASGKEDKLHFTKMWLKRNKHAEIPNESEADILNNAFMELLQQENQEIDVPETLLSNINKFIEIRNSSYRLSVIASIILVTMSTVGSALRDISDFRKQLKDHVCLLLPEEIQKGEITGLLQNICDQIIKESTEFLKKHGFPQLSKNVESVLSGQIKEIGEGEHKIRTICLNRIHEFLRKSISNDRPTCLQIPVGLTAIEYELGAVAKCFVTTVSHNKAVYSEFYNQVLESI